MHLVLDLGRIDGSRVLGLFCYHMPDIFALKLKEFTRMLAPRRPQTQSHEADPISALHENLFRLAQNIVESCWQLSLSRQRVRNARRRQLINPFFVIKKSCRN